MESRLGHDFSQVRVHTGVAAARTARALDSRAFTLGRHIVFGDGEYRPRDRAGRRLLAHELAHVIQQGSAPRHPNRPAPPLSAAPAGLRLQRSPLSDSVRAAYKADPSLEALLARLSQSDVQSAQKDTDVDTVIKGLLAGHPDDLWVARQIRQGRLIENSGRYGRQRMPRRPIRAYFFPGRTHRRALVIAGVHGSEVQGIEVAHDLVTQLKAGEASKPPVLPYFSVIVVPSLFPDNAAHRRRQGKIQTNRNFPAPSRGLATARRGPRHRPLDALKKPILAENILLMALMERFRPERIISIHGTWRAGAAGVFYDPRSLTNAEYKRVQQCATARAYMAVPVEQQWGPDGRRELQKAHDHFLRVCLADAFDAARAQDKRLSLATAKAIDASTASITGREKRHFANREHEHQPVPAAQVAARKRHPSVAGDVGTSGKLDTAHWSGKAPKGYSLGSYAPPQGMSVFTVEPPLNCTSADYRKGGHCAHRADAGVSVAERRMELKSYAEAIRTILLGR